MQVIKQQLELDMEQWTGSNLGKEYIKSVYCLPAYLTSMHSTSWETLGWMKHKLEQQGYLLSPCLFILYAECIVQNARPDEL